MDGEVLGKLILIRTKSKSLETFLAKYCSIISLSIVTL